MGKDREDPGVPVLKDTLNFTKSILGRDLTWGELRGFIDLTEMRGAAEVNERLRDIIGGIREEKNVVEYSDRLFRERGLSIVDVVALDFSYADDMNPREFEEYDGDTGIDWGGQLFEEDNKTWSGA